MQFLSFSFLALFTLCFFLYYAVKGRARNLILLVTSCIFIGWYYLPFLLTAVVVALFTFFWAQWMESRAKAGKKTKPVYIAGIIALIGGWLLLHGTVIDDIIFPLGMSFYTFQAISYLTDVYWQEQRSERNWVDFLIYMLFFMKFLSGPIERGGDLLPQLKDPRPFIYSNAVTGLKYILLGLIKKLLIANQISPQTDVMFHSIHDLLGCTTANDLPTLPYRTVCRFFGLYGYCYRRGLYVRHQVVAQLQPPVCSTLDCRLLAPLAHVTLLLGTRLSLCTANRRYP